MDFYARKVCQEDLRLFAGCAKVLLVDPACMQGRVLGAYQARMHFYGFKRRRECP
jgi:hypothetical protein